MSDQETCEHEWDSYMDWEGDPSVPNGTHSWIVYRCIFCDIEVTSLPKDEMPEVDVLYDYDETDSPP